MGNQVGSPRSLPNVEEESEEYASPAPAEAEQSLRFSSDHEVVQRFSRDVFYVISLHLSLNDVLACAQGTTTLCFVQGFFAASYTHLSSFFQCPSGSSTWPTTIRFGSAS